MPKENILVFGDDAHLKNALYEYKDEGHRAMARSFRAFKGDFEDCDRVVMLRENDRVRKVFEQKGVKVTVKKVEWEAPTKDEIRSMKWFEKKKMIKRLTGQAPFNAIEAEYLINQIPDD
jgi:hypothetical protein